MNGGPSNHPAAQGVANTVQSAGKGDAKGICEQCCQNRIKEIDDQTNKIAAINDPIERNKAITKAYTEVAAQDPQDRWVKLASVVSAQGGCAMHKVQDMRSNYPAWKDALDEKTGLSGTNNMYHALGDANKTIFTDIYPVAAYKAKYGWQNLKDCYDAEGKKLEPDLRKAFDKMDQGRLREGADGIAEYEQGTVVQSVYDKYPVTMWAMQKYSDATKLVSGKNQYDIPVSTQCGDPDTVPFVGEIAKANDRIGYYHALMNKLGTIQKW